MQAYAGKAEGEQHGSKAGVNNSKLSIPVAFQQALPPDTGLK